MVRITPSTTLQCLKALANSHQSEQLQGANLTWAFGLSETNSEYYHLSPTR